MNCSLQFLAEAGWIFSLPVPPFLGKRNVGSMLTVLEVIMIKLLGWESKLGIDAPPGTIDLLHVVAKCYLAIKVRCWIVLKFYF